jgi:preprotein translocase subunit SecE
MSGVQVLQGALDKCSCGRLAEGRRTNPVACLLADSGRVPLTSIDGPATSLMAILSESSVYTALKREQVMTRKDEGLVVEEKAGFNPSAFVQETKDELAKVTWPSRQQLISESLAVILMVSLSAFLVYAVDQLFQWVQVKVFG